MQPETQTTCSLSRQDSAKDSAKEDREKFSHQTLILTALTAITTPNQHPSFNDHFVKLERLHYMEKSRHTRVIDAATTILVTDTEILATMARGANSIVALKEINRGDKDHSVLRDLLDSESQDVYSKSNQILGELNSKSNRILGEVDELLPGEFEMNSDPVIDEDHHAPAKDPQVFVSFPNPNSSIAMPSSDRICKPIAPDNGYWPQIWESKEGYIFESTQ